MLDRRSWLTLGLLLLPVALLVLGAEHSGVRVFERIAINHCISLALVVGLQVFMGNSGIRRSPIWASWGSAPTPRRCCRSRRR
jgi:hypothetical protein